MVGSLAVQTRVDPVVGRLPITGVHRVSPFSRAPADLLFQVTGWRVASHKRRRPSDRFACLGVEFYVPHHSPTLMVVSNRPGRASELTETVNAILDAGRLSPSVAASVIGRFV